MRLPGALRKGLHPSRLRELSPGGGRLADAGAVLLLLVLSVVSYRTLATDEGFLVGLDSASQFYPWYAFLGETLRSGELPGWNPHQFSGAPLAADPLSGWTYLPAMVLFTLLPLVPAAKAYVFAHLLFAGLTSFALARVLGFRLLGALVAAVSYEFGSYFYVRNVCCFAFASVMVWLPVAILGAELALRSRTLLDRLLWCALSGLAVSQILASWLGQGSYYALLALGGYVGYRALLFPPEHLRGLRGRLLGALTVGPLVLLFGFGLAAAGLLPRLEYNALSGLAEGYDQALPSEGWRLAEWWGLLLPPSDFYLGAGVVLLVLLAPFLLGRNPREGPEAAASPPGVPYLGVPYFAALALGALTLSGEGVTLLHSALYGLPLFESLLPYRAVRFMVVFFIAASLLAGAAVSLLGERRRGVALASLPLLGALFLATRSSLRLDPDEPPPEPAADAGLWSEGGPRLLGAGVELVPGAFFALLAVAALLAVYALLPPRRRVFRGLVAGALVLVLFVDLNASGAAILEERTESRRETERIHRVDLEAYYAPTGATRFLQDSADPPFRYFGYAARYGSDFLPRPLNILYTDRELTRLEPANRATVHGGDLQSIQGYNAVHLARYDRYLRAMNGREQNYHDADVFSGGVYSPLLDLLNVRYVLVPDGPPASSPPSLRYLKDEFRLAYAGSGVRILENPDALPRAWIVHETRRAGPERTLDLLRTGEVDPRQTALLEEDLPLERPPEPGRAEVTEYGPNRLSVETQTGAAGLLVLSEVHYPAWRAYVNGEPAEVLRANYLFRAVEVPAGESVVELRYSSTTLRGGVLISALFVLCAGGLLALRLGLLPLGRRGPRRGDG